MSVELRSFNDILLESIDEALSRMGEETKRTVIFYLGKLYGIDMSTITENLGLLEKALDLMFKDGSWIVKKWIIETLYGKIGVKKLVTTGTLVSLVEDARIEYERQQALKYSRRPY